MKTTHITQGNTSPTAGEPKCNYADGVFIFIIKVKS